MLKIGVDAMGGDYAPEAAVKGAVMALEELGAESRIVLFGDEEKIRAILAAESCPADRFDIVATTEVIEMGDHPAKAFQQKSDSSIAVGFGYLAKGLIHGFASAGSTGAMMVGSMYAVKPIEGVIRPTISSLVPTASGRPALILDVGLNVDCKPEVLVQYGLIGSIYAEAVLGAEITVPTIDGDVKYNISEGTQTGTVFRLKGKGIQKLQRSDRGNQYVKINVEVPKNLTKKQKDLLKAFEDSLNEKNYAKRQSFFEKLKKKFDI